MKQSRKTQWLAEAKESLLMALGAVAAHKLRSALTLLGVLIGVFSIIVVMTSMRVLKSNVENEMSQLGVNTFALQKWPAVHFSGPEGDEKYWRRKNISLAQGRIVQEKATLAQAVGIEEDFWGGQVETRFQKTPPNVKLLGETPGSFPAKNWTVMEGRALNEGDVDNARDVCVLGDLLARTVFPLGSAVGEKLKINGLNYTVVGVLAPKGATLNGQQDNFAIIPITTALNRYGNWWRSMTILVQARDRASYDDCLEQVRGILRVARKVPPGAEDDFEVFSNDSVIAQFNTFTLAVRMGVAVVSCIALLAAGIGIMNIMLVSVTERTREIGIRRAIGAKKRNIMTQFIVEAVVLCEVGGVIGVALGILGGNAVAVYFKVPPTIPFDWIAIGLGICSMVGVIFGTYPAFKAANLDPIESLRYE
ncbi:MAG: FtsX-like permease family protein [Verrucomicrobia bacterium]|nr:FtsX-like permease family protein [Verrucomicrobiota bacterium]